MLHRNADPACPPQKPCARDMHELIYQQLTPLLIKLTPLKQLRRRLREITLEHPRFREEAPLVLAGEKRRRQLHGGLVVTSKAQPLTAQQHG